MTSYDCNHLMIQSGQMNLTIQRGTHEIGGSCVELCSDSGESRIVIDVGMPLVTPDRLPFEWHRYKGLPQEQLLEQGVLPAVDGLYSHQKPSISAVILSHAHQDHYGFIRFVHPNIPLYMSLGTKGLVEVSNLFLGTGVNLDLIRTFTMWQPFQVEEFITTPYLMDHSAPDAAAFLIEADGQRLFYSGDFRGHGRKQVLLERLSSTAISSLDCLIMEGSMMGRDAGRYPDENAVEQAMYEIMVDQRSYTFVFCSSQNLDRLVSIYRAVKRTHKTLVIDLYTAFALDKLSSISSRIPQFDWNEIRVLYAYSHAKKLAERDKKLLYRYRKAKIEWNEIRSNPHDMVILSKDNRYFRMMLQKLSASGEAKAIYSMWHGYLERTNLAQVLESQGIELIEIHTSGHAYVEDLKRLACAMNPRCLVPIHTFYPDQYGSIHENIVQLDDGETYYL
ncbi:Ribonuclease J [subsurface metagenome]